MTENELLAELMTELMPMIESDELTARMLANSAGISHSMAVSMLKGKLQAGELTSRQVRMPNGHYAEAYRKA